ncbi:MAG TPA: helix-turn-helix transcriptional regulator, partial [Myxococcaceae bacterium]|nr:helix-turn-helix transcriptional regulator [Myxococcaceae bacterium]
MHSFTCPGAGSRSAWGLGRSLRERRGMTQEDFAQRGGISISFASLLERGERSPSYETLVQ